MERKVAAGGLGGAVSTIGIWALGEYGGVHPPPEVAAAIATVIVVIVAWLVPSVSLRQVGKVAMVAIGLTGLSAAPSRAEWATTEIRGAIDIVELVTPLFGEAGGVSAGAALNFGLGWRQIDGSDDGLKPWGVYVGASWNIADPFNFHWVQLTGGATYEEVLQVGTGLWLGNATETAVNDSTGEVETWVVPGLNLKNPVVLGFGVQGEPTSP